MCFCQSVEKIESCTASFHSLDLDLAQLDEMTVIDNVKPA